MSTGVNVFSKINIPKTDKIIIPESEFLSAMKLIFVILDNITTLDNILLSSKSCLPKFVIN